MSRLFRFAENDKCRQISLELNSWGLHWGLERERKIHCHKCTFSVKCEIRHFHTAVLQWWQRNEQKSVIVVVLLDKLVAFFDFLIVIPVIVAKAPFISPSPIINIHVFLAMTLENSRGQGGEGVQHAFWNPSLFRSQPLFLRSDWWKKTPPTQFQNQGSAEHTTLPCFNKKCSYNYNFSNYHTPNFRLKGVQN